MPLELGSQIYKTLGTAVALDILSFYDKMPIGTTHLVKRFYSFS